MSSVIMRRRNRIVREYQGGNNLPGAEPPDFTQLSLDQRIAAEVLHNGIERPKGYTVSWHFNPAVEGHHFGKLEPMKPYRFTLTKQLILAYGLHTAMDLYLSRAATEEELKSFHTDDYVDFLRRVTPKTLEQFPLEKFNIGGDCPVFDGLWNFCSNFSGASIDAARKLCNGQSDIAINWTGGLHHAKKGSASGFCYINDIVLAILQLLRYHPRVLYIDIDVHHGDGVEQAFYSTDRVMTCSFHRYEKDIFFPGTGGPEETGPADPRSPGAYHAVNVPLNAGMEDRDYIMLFQEVITSIMEAFSPTAIVLQCGADSLGGDRLGDFNLNIQAHGACVSFVKALKVPLLVLGGGGYTPRNVARAWTHETALCVGAELHEDLPTHTPFLHAFKPDKTLFPDLVGRHPFKNRNSKSYLANVVRNIKEQLRYVKGAPSVQMQDIPPDVFDIRHEVDEELEEELMELDDARRVEEAKLGTMSELV